MTISLKHLRFRYLPPYYPHHENASSWGQLCMAWLNRSYLLLVNMTCRNFLIFLSCFFCSVGYCQTNPPIVVPLAPDAAEFAKYSNIPVNGSTGIPNISLPIYEINTGKIKVPISISYHASGILVNQFATWIGLGWSLNAGGIISRGVRGLPDESQNGWFNNPGATKQITDSKDADFLWAYSKNVYDSHPDFFSYSTPDLAGRFIYSQSTNSFQTIPNETIKISRLTGGGNNVDNTYQITESDGNIYYYQDKQIYFNDGDGSITDNKYTQSWYLTKIVSADTKDTVQFHYTSSTVLGGSNEETGQTDIHSYETGEDDMQYQDKGQSSSESYFYHSYLALEEITFKQGKVVFSSNTPRRDYSGCMLDNIVVYSRLNNIYTPVYKFQFDHDYFTTSQPKNDHFDYRLKLTSLHKIAVSGRNDVETHKFYYNNTPLPSIQSHAMDYWGYYNGAAVTNSLLPNLPPDAPDLFLFRANSQLIGSGNRNSDAGYMQAGILEKIIYPTKGYTSFTYEPHQYLSDHEDLVSSTVASVITRGVTLHKKVTSTTDITWPSDVPGNVGFVDLRFSAYNMGAYDYSQLATLKDVTAGKNLAIWEHIGNNATAYNVSTSFVFDPTHKYQIVLLVDDNSPTNISFTLTSQKTVKTTTAKSGAGLRVAQIQHFDYDTQLATTEKFQYLGVDIGKNDVAIANNYRTITTYKYPLSTALPCSQVPRVIKTIIYYGTQTFGGQSFEGANVLYKEVRKTAYDSQGKQNGQTISLYDISRSFGTIYNPSMPGGREYIDNSLGRASLPISETTYSSDADGSLKPVRSKVYTYGNPGAYFQEPVMQVSANHLISPSSLNCYTMQDFTKYDYFITCGSTKLASVVESDYSVPESPITVNIKYDYNNPDHLEPNKITKYGSDGKAIVTENKYPFDFSDSSYGSDLLRVQSIKNKILEQTITKNNSLRSKTATAYRNSLGTVVADRAIKSLIDGTMETRLVFDKYDEDGNLVELSTGSGSSALKTSYQWGYNNMYPVAECKNAARSEFFFEGFESSTETGTYSDGGHTGNNYHFGNYTINWTPPNSRSYILNYWFRKNGIWQLSDYQVFNGERVTLSGAEAYDDIRIQPFDATLITYTYNSLVGMTSSTDSKGYTTYYSYDGLQRLITLKDNNGNIIKNIDYHLKP